MLVCSLMGAYLCNCVYESCECVLLFVSRPMCVLCMHVLAHTMTYQFTRHCYRALSACAPHQSSPPTLALVASHEQRVTVTTS